MSNYPAPPPFGLPYSTNPNLPPTVGPRYAGMPPYTYQPQPQNLYMPNQAQGNSKPPAQHANAYAFGSNAQGAMQVPYMNGMGQPPFGRFGRMPQGVVTPPSYPLARMPPYGPPPYTAPQSSFQPATSSNPAISHHNTPVEITNPHLVVTENLAKEVSNPSAPSTPGLEEGEWDAGDASQTGHESSKTLSTNARPVQEIPTPADSQSVGTASQSRTPVTPATQPARPGDAASNTMSASDPRHLAHNILRELHSYGIEYQDILSEGLDPYTLKRLYQEIGLSELSSSVKKQLGQNDQLLDAAASEHTNKRSDVATFEIEKHPPLDPNTIPVPVASIGFAQDCAAPPIHDSSGSDGKALPVSSSPVVENSKSAMDKPTAKSTATSSSNMSGKVSNKIGESKVVDRKEYIARMLAAKTGKSMSTPSTAPVAPKTRAQNASDTGSIPLPPKPSATTNGYTVPPEIVDSSSTSDSQSNVDVSLEAKRKAQTELARQKMEALRLKNLQNESQSQSSKQTESMGQTGHIVPNIAPSRCERQDEPPTEPTLPVLPCQPSSFSPVAQTSAFSIPGLFMSSDPSNSGPQSSTSKQPLQVPDGQLHHLIDTRSTQPVNKSVGRSEAIPQSKTLATESAAMNDSPSESPGLGPRKRRRAADFIDSPSRKLRDFLGQQEDASVIIDISDEESEMSAEDVDMLIAGEQATITRHHELSRSDAGRQRVVRDLPPLTEYPPKRKNPYDSANMTPNTIHTPGKAQEPEELKSKEMEIEFMKRKIAELEQQRLKPKQAGSRTQSPAMPAQITHLQALSRPPSGNTETTKAPEGPEEDSDASIEQTLTQQPFSTETRNNNITTQGPPSLQKEKVMENLAATGAEYSHLIEPSTHAGEEPGRANDNADVTMHDIEALKCQDKQSPSHNQADSTVQNLEETHVQEIWPEAPRDAVSGLGQQSRDSLSPPIEVEHASTQDQDLLERNRLRKAEIETNLPQIDAELARTRGRLELLRAEMAQLENEVQQGAEGKRALFEELIRLSKAIDAAQDVSQSSPSVEEHDAAERRRGGRIDASLPSQFLGGSVLQQGATAIGSPTSKEAVIEQSTIAKGTASPESPISQASDGELEEDVMDISHSDIDEGEISSDSTDLLPQKVDYHPNEETYKPHPDVGPIRQHDRASSGTTSRSAVSTSVPFSPTAQANGGTGPVDVDAHEKADDVGVIDMGITDMQTMAHSPPLGSSLDHTSDTEDDYEPPEPAPIDERNPEGDSNDIDGIAEEKALEPVPPDGQFTPYESPLKHFRSSRLRHESEQEVSIGFRSLTYSHAINPETPICPYELGGVCNDESCTNQHFKDMRVEWCVD